MDKFWQTHNVWSNPFLYYLLEKPEALVNFFGFLLTIFTFTYVSYKDRRVQRRRNYLELEFESSRIFQVCVENPQVTMYLDGRLAADKASPELDERTYWFVCQCLNTFEIIISYRREGVVTKDLFATWVSWFHELGTAERFVDYWDGRDLCYHYKPELQEIMMTAVRLRSERAPDFDADSPAGQAELEAFHRRVSEILKDPAILAHFTESATRTEQLRRQRLV